MSEKITVELAHGRAGIQALRPAWMSLLASRPGYAYYHHPLWYEAMNDFLLDEELKLLQLWRGDKLELIAPLLGGKGRVCNPRHDHIVLSDWIIDPTLATADLLAELPALLTFAGEGRWSRLWLHDFVSAAVLHDGLQSAATAGAPLMSTIRQTRRSAWFDTSGAQTPIPGKLRRNLKRLRKKGGEVRVQTVDSADALAFAFRQFLRIEASGWKGRQNTSIDADVRLRGFYHALISADQPGVRAEIRLLELDGQAVAAQLGLRTPGLLSLLKIGFDEQHAALSPGSLLLEQTLEIAVSDSDTQRVSLVTDPAWADRWHPQRTQVSSIRIYNNTTAGQAYLGVDRFRATAVSLCRSLRKRSQKH